MPNYIAREVERLAEDLGVDRKRSIGEVAKELEVKPHVIRFWEENFPQIHPEIGVGKRRYYYNKQVKVLRAIKRFLYEEGYTIAGLQKMLRRRKHDDLDFERDLEIISVAMGSAQVVDYNEQGESDSVAAIGNSSSMLKDEFEIDDFITEKDVLLDGKREAALGEIKELIAQIRLKLHEEE